jgi:hypothetical protein
MPTYKVRYAHIRASVSGVHAVAGRRVRARHNAPAAPRRLITCKSRDRMRRVVASSREHEHEPTAPPRRDAHQPTAGAMQSRRGGGRGGDDVQISRREPLTTAFRPGHPAAAHGRVSAAAWGDTHDARMRAHVQQTNHARPAPPCALEPPTKPCIPRRVRCASLCKHWHWHAISQWHTRCSASQEGQGSRSVGVGKSMVPAASTRR